MMPVGNQIRKITFLLLVLICLCSLAGQASGLWWFFDLFNHFRPQAFLATLFLFALSIISRDIKCLFFAIAIMVFNGALMIERLYAFPASKRDNQVSYIEGKIKNFSVVFSNILTSNKQHTLFIDMIHRENPDILVVAEINKEWKNIINKEISIYKHSAIIERQDNFGMAIYSKFPFKHMIHMVGTYKLPMIVADFGNFVLTSAHPMPPVSSRSNDELLVYMQKVSQIIKETKKPVVLVGDFNSTMWSDAMKNLRNLGLMRTNISGFAWTWPSNFWPLAVQIDHIFARDVVTADFDVLPYTGSDHFPIKSHITIQTQ